MKAAEIPSHRGVTHDGAAMADGMPAMTRRAITVSLIRRRVRRRMAEASMGEPGKSEF
jgi:hypothetical protein